jgi:hypothetical protein
MIFSLMLCTCIFKSDHDHYNFVLHPHFHNPGVFSPFFISSFKIKHMFTSCNALVAIGLLVFGFSGLAFSLFCLSELCFTHHSSTGQKLWQKCCAFNFLIV